MTGLIHIDLIRENNSAADREKRYPSRASCETGGTRFRTEGSSSIYKLATLLFLHGHAGQDFEVRDDRSPTGGPGGLAMTGKVRNWAVWNGHSWVFRWGAKCEPGFMADQVRDIVKSAGKVADLDQKAPPCHDNARLCA